MSWAGTPGPWFVFGNGHCVGGQASDDAEAIPTAGVAACGMGRRPPAETRANAAAIACLPDLLEAADDMVRTLSAEGYDVAPYRALLARAGWVQS